MKFLDTYRLVHNEEFRSRVQTAAYLVARDILNDAGDTSDRRHLLARQATRLDEPVVDALAWACATNPTIAAAEQARLDGTGSGAPDGDLQFVVTSVWDKVSETR